MDLNKIFFETRNGQRRLQPRVVIWVSAGLFGLFALAIFLQAQQNATTQIDSPFTRRAATSRPGLDYNIVKIDTISLGDHLKTQQPEATPPAPVQTVAPKPQAAERGTGASRKPDRAAEYPASPRLTSTNPSANVVADPNPNMIVHSSMGAANQAGGGARFGTQSALVKVTLTDKVSVSNNSLMEARVLNEASLGTTLIPRRARLSGIASLQGSRVYVEFREIRIEGVSHGCSGRAYDMKKQLGLPYAAAQAVQASASKAVVDELKGAASGIPVVGRYANQANTNSLTDETARFDEGYEFYVQINSIF